jgi:NUMOD4 motif/HNH endonuclease
MSVSEEWRTIPGLEGEYEASSLGRVRSLDRHVISKHGARIFKKGRILSPSLHRQGYLVFAKKPGKFAHRLVARAFLANPDSLPQVNHINAIKSDNRPENLEWCTGGHNVRHSFALGLVPRHNGDTQKQSKLNSDAVRAIRVAYEQGIATQKQLAQKYKISQAIISRVVRYELWKHVIS